MEFKLLLQRCTEETGHGLGLRGILLRIQVRELAQRQRRIVAGWEAVVEGLDGFRTVHVSWKGDPRFEDAVARFPLLREGRPFLTAVARGAALWCAGARGWSRRGVWTRYITATRGSL